MAAKYIDHKSLPNWIATSERLQLTNYGKPPNRVLPKSQVNDLTN